MKRATIKRLAIGIVLALVTGIGFFVQLPTAHAGSAVIEPTGFNAALYDLSDDGRYLAYVKLPNEVDSSSGLVWYDLQAGTRRWLVEGETPEGGTVRITADNQTVLWVKNLPYEVPDSASLWKVTVATGDAASLMPTQDAIHLKTAVSSGDGRFIAFASEDANNGNTVWVFDIQTQTLRNPPGTHYDGEDTLEVAAITPNGNQLILHIIDDGYHTIEAVPRTSGSILVLASPSLTPIENVTLTPDGSAVYFFLGASATQLYHVPFSAPAAVAIGNAGLAHSGIQFSPDGLYGFYSHYVNGQGTVFRLTLADQSIAPLHSTTIYFANAEHLGITVAPTGNRIVIAEANNGNSDTSIHLLSVRYDVIEPPRLLTTEHGVNTTLGGELRDRRIPLIITPDGAYVIYTQPSGDGFYLNRVALEGSTLPVRLYLDPTVRNVLLSRSEAGLFFNVNISSQGYGVDDLYYLDFSDLNPKLLYRGQTHRIQLREPALDDEIIFTTRPRENDIGLTLRRASSISAAYFNYRELATIGEGSSREMTVDFYPSSADTVTVTYSAISGTATLGDDFTLSPTQLVFAPGQVSQTLTITALADATLEGLETATLQFQNQQNDVTTLLDLSFNEIVAVSDAPARLAITSEDGRYAVFQEAYGNLVGLYSKDLATGARYELQAPDAVLTMDDPVALSPDGSTVLYRSGSRIFQVPFTGGVSTPLLTGICDPVFSITSDSHYAQVLSNCAEDTDPVYKIDLTTATTATLVANEALSGIPLAASPDGNVVVYKQAQPMGVEILRVVPTTGATTAVINHDTNYAVFDSPTTFLYVRYTEPDRILTRFNIITGSSTPIFALPNYSEGFHYSTERQMLYYRTHNNSLNRYKIGALNADSMGGRAATSWLLPVADDSQFLYYQEYAHCHRYGCDIVSGDVGTVSAAGDQWRSSVPALYTNVNPDGNALVYGEWYGITTKLYQKSLLPMGAEREVTAFPNVRNDPSVWRTGDNRIYASIGSTLQSTSLHVDTPAVTQFRNSHLPSLYAEPQRPKNLTLFMGDILYFQDVEGYLYAVADNAPPMSVTSTGALVAEGETVTVTISLATTPLTTATVAVNIMGGTATIGTDVSAPPATLTFAPFQREQTFTLTASTDGVTESVEELHLTFTPISGASVGANNTYRLRIADQLYRQQLPLMQHTP